MKKLLLVLFFVTGCEKTWGGAGLELTPTIDSAGADMELAVWEEEVAIAASEWNAALEALGCDTPFVMSDDGHRVTLVSREAWQWGDRTAGITHYNPDWIEVKSIPDLPGGHPRYDRVLLHELGHAMGIQHQPTGVMQSVTSLSTLQPEDIAAGAAELGCGP